ncbi:hypothetical protein SYNTR_0902 [Candidatus Syntrophocurvum alkaliphilum]|uniref:Uncharacterized protein n=1 Tax=Candidatus Syntrophocurvum alkaliphilum TaxID=2293317 RepID=A0A6I6D9J3_9FIRM|nr:hypothetical protein [Candidatus Syntrophocurvum alkaliphilum]QGT99495.1 hypothetical protein SYNTR_0902 [Candidatus Syntrophocurvum alkaliphilum]
MSKGQGQKIGIKFTQLLTNTTDDINQNKQAFNVEGEEFKHVNGEEIEKKYTISEVKYRPPVASSEIKFEEGEVIDLEIIGDRLILEFAEGDGE